MPLMRFIAVTIAACPSGTVPPWNVVYSTVAATAARYVRRVPPDAASGTDAMMFRMCAVIRPPGSSGGCS